MASIQGQSLERPDQVDGSLVFLAERSLLASDSSRLSERVLSAAVQYNKSDLVTLYQSLVQSTPDLCKKIFTGKLSQRAPQDPPAPPASLLNSVLSP